MDLVVRRVGEGLVASFARKMNLEGEASVRFKDRLKGVISEGARYVVIDLSNVGFVDSQGLGALISAYKVLRQDGGAVVLADISSPVEAILRITRLIRVFDVYPTVNEALEAATSGAGTPGTANSGTANSGTANSGTAISGNGANG